MSRPHLLDVRALTLLNPWAHAVAHLGKNVENRSWQPPESVDQILIHAAQRWDRRGLRELTDAGHDIDTATTPTGAIVAVVDLAWVCDTSARKGDRGRRSCGCSSWAIPGLIHWNLGTVWTLTEPVPCSGRQRLWRPSQNLVDQVREQVAHV